LLGQWPSKKIGEISFEALLGAAGLKLVVVEDPEALDRVRSRLIPSHHRISGATRRRVVVKFSRDFLVEIGRKGGLKAAANARARKAKSEKCAASARVRWHRATA
jgi:hypothetical protein